MLKNLWQKFFPAAKPGKEYDELLAMLYDIKGDGKLTETKQLDDGVTIKFHDMPHPIALRITWSLKPKAISMTRHEIMGYPCPDVDTTMLFVRMYDALNLTMINIKLDRGEKVSGITFYENEHGSKRTHT